MPKKKLPLKASYDRDIGAIQIHVGKRYVAVIDLYHDDGDPVIAAHALDAVAAAMVRGINDQGHHLREVLDTAGRR